MSLTACIYNTQQIHKTVLNYNRKRAFLSNHMQRYHFMQRSRDSPAFVSGSEFHRCYHLRRSAETLKTKSPTSLTRTTHNINKIQRINSIKYQNPTDKCVKLNERVGTRKKLNDAFFSGGNSCTKIKLINTRLMELS